ncbi:hypothetical protein HispidOSU_026735, partial [Sigmodon hispidus]
MSLERGDMNMVQEQRQELDRDQGAVFGSQLARDAEEMRLQGDEGKDYRLLSELKANDYKARHTIQAISHQSAVLTKGKVSLKVNGD